VDCQDYFETWRLQEDLVSSAYREETGEDMRRSVGYWGSKVAGSGEVAGDEGY
jgi:hypothetical protein